MAFVDTIQRIPFRPVTPTGGGFLPPIGRASVHIGHLVACINDEDITVLDEEAIEELSHAQTHWHARVNAQALSTASVAFADDIETAITEAINEYPDWDADTRVSNIRNLGHRVAQFWAQLDRECIGIRDSDPGSQM